MVDTIDAIPPRDSHTPPTNRPATTPTAAATTAIGGEPNITADLSAHNDVETVAGELPKCGEP